jgi:hypothetical protein
MDEMIQTVVEYAPFVGAMLFVLIKSEARQDKMLDVITQIKPLLAEIKILLDTLNDRFPTK